MNLKSMSTALAITLALALIVLGQTPQVAKLEAKAVKDAAPKLAISKTQHDFGEIKKGTLAQYSFTFKNEGVADLVINNVAPACGCTTSDFTKVVPPGQEGKITLAVHTENFNGVISKSAEVYTNDAQRPQFALLMSMNVVAPAGPPPAPKLAISKLQHDFGEIKRGTVAQYSFTFKNEGTADLVINNVSPACGCTASEYTKLIPPGQEGKVTLTLHTESYNGPVSKSAEVFTNDPQRAQFTLIMSMVISAPEMAPVGKRIGALVISPVDRWSAEVPLGLGTGGVISIYNDSPQPLKITKLEAGGESFSVMLNPLEDGKRYAVNFTPSPKLPLGTYHQTVKLATDSKETPELTLELDLRVVPPVKVNPAKVVFDNVPVSIADYDISSLSKFTWVTITRGEGLEIKSLTSDLPFIKAKVESVDGNKNTYLLRIGFSDRPPKGRHQGVLKVETNNKDVPVVEVPLVVNAQ